MTLLDYFKIFIVILGLSAGALSALYILSVILEPTGLNRLARSLMGRLGRKRADAPPRAATQERQAEKESDHEGVGRPPLNKDRKLDESEVEDFFRGNFGPGSFYRYARDEDYRKELDSFLQRINDEAKPQSNSKGESETD